jgi:glutathione reductase (NADPH)
VNEFDYDLFVIGAGSGGVRASRVAASLGAKVAIAEHHRVGGTCVIRGCIPKKLLVYASHFHEDFEDALGYGWELGAASFSWPRLIAAKNIEIARLELIYQGLLERSGVVTLNGTARLVDEHSVEIGGKRVTARYILIATGGWPYMPPIRGIEHAISSNDAFELAELPKRILIVGGGYIALEFAGIFNGLGSAVTVSYRGEQILRGFDDDVRRHVNYEMEKKGIRILLHSDVEDLERRADRTLSARFFARHFDDVVADAVMFATGRVPNTLGLGLEHAGVELDADGAVVVDRYSRSNVPSIFAVGDVTNRIALTPVAIREGQAVALTLFGGDAVAMDHSDVASAVFSQPAVGTVGLTESEAQVLFAEIELYRASFRPLKATLSGREERVFMKLVVDAVSQRVLGAHMVGSDAPEVIQGIAIAIKAGLTKAQFDATVGIHPSVAEEFVTLRDKTVVKGTLPAAA